MEMRYENEKNTVTKGRYTLWDLDFFQQAISESPQASVSKRG